MELRQLRYLVTLADELHFTRAAAQEHIAVGAFSEQISRLERELGTPLFLRTTRQVELTEVGSAVVSHARQVQGATVVEVEASHAALVYRSHEIASVIVSATAG